MQLIKKSDIPLDLSKFEKDGKFFETQNPVEMIRLKRDTDYTLVGIKTIKKITTKYYYKNSPVAVKSE